jgi:hypothetical protein
MARFQIWDIPSATLLDETDDIRIVAETVQSLVESEGTGILDDISMSEALDGEHQFRDHTGSDLMLTIQEHLEGLVKH